MSIRKRIGVFILTSIISVSSALNIYPSMVINAVAENTEPAVTDSVEEQNSKQIVKSEVVSNSKNIKVTKTISATGTENLFNVETTIDTVEKAELESQDAAVVFVVDLSTSMQWDGKKMEDARSAMQSFMDSYLASAQTSDHTYKRYAAIVPFYGQLADGTDPRFKTTYPNDFSMPWTDAADSSTGYQWTDMPHNGTYYDQNNNSVDNTVYRDIHSASAGGQFNHTTDKLDESYFTYINGMASENSNLLKNRTVNTTKSIGGKTFDYYSYANLTGEQKVRLAINNLQCHYFADGYEFGWTNTDLGIVTANSYLNDSTVKDIDHKYVVLVTDGLPNLRSNYSVNTKDTYGKKVWGSQSPIKSYDDFYRYAAYHAFKLKAEQNADFFSVFILANNTGESEKVKIKTWLKYVSDSYASAEDGEELKKQLQKISKTIQQKTNAWVYSDPLCEPVKLVDGTFDQDNLNANTVGEDSSGLITWDLPLTPYKVRQYTLDDNGMIGAVDETKEISENTVRTDTNGHYVYEYKLSYQIALDNTNDFLNDHPYNVSGESSPSLTYVIRRNGEEYYDKDGNQLTLGENDSPKRGFDIESDDKKITVKGYLGQISALKKIQYGSEEKNLPSGDTATLAIRSNGNEVLNTLTVNNKYPVSKPYSKTVSGGSDSVTFTSIPSGTFSYKLSEIGSSPEGVYENDGGSYTFRFKYGEITDLKKVSGSETTDTDAANVKFVNALKSGVLTIQKVVETDNAPQNTKFTFAVHIKDSRIGGSYPCVITSPDNVRQESSITDGGKITMNKDQKAEITLPAGAAYYVTEENIPQGYSLDTDSSKTVNMGSADSPVTVIGGSTVTCTVSNTYSAAGQIKLSGVKTLTGTFVTSDAVIGHVTVQNADAAEDLSLKLESADDATAQAIQDGVIEISGNGTATISKDVLTAGSTADAELGTLTFLQAGKYHFKVSQVIPGSVPAGWNYDTDVKNIIATVRYKDDGSLTAEISGDTPSFTNTWSGSADETNSETVVPETTDESEETTSNDAGNVPEDSETPDQGNDTPEIKQDAESDQQADTEVSPETKEEPQNNEIDDESQESAPAVDEVAYYLSDQETSVDPNVVNTALVISASEHSSDQVGSGDQNTATAEDNGGTFILMANNNGVVNKDFDQSAFTFLIQGPGFPDEGQAINLKGYSGENHKTEINYPVLSFTTADLNTMVKDGKASVDFANGLATYHVSYTISENVPAEPAKSYCNYDSTVYKLSLDIVDQGNGSYRIVPANGSADPGKLDFNNTYRSHAVSVDIKGSKQINALKTSDIKDRYTFTIQEDSNDGTSVLPAKTEAAMDDNGVIDFGTISFDENDLGEHAWGTSVQKTFHYVIRENGTVAKVTNDSTSKSVDITVKDDGYGNLSASVNGNGFTFVNSYSDHNESSPTDEGAVTIAKTLTGRSLDENDVFHFVLKDPDGNVVSNGTNDETGKVTMSKITFSEKNIGTHTYTLSETAGSDTRIQYDPSEYVLTASVSVDQEHGNSLKVQWSCNAKDGTINFINAFTYSSITVDDPPVNKVLAGDTPASAATFHFILSADPDGSSLKDGVVMPLPEKTTVTVTGSGKAEEFGNLIFSEPGTYVYHIREANDQAANYSYDSAVYTVTYIISEDADHNLSSARTVTKGNDMQDSVVFTNSYHRPSEKGKSTSGSTVYTAPVKLIPKTGADSLKTED